MKKFKSLIYVLALALIFVGAANVTKASADDPQGDTNAKVTVNVAGTATLGSAKATKDGESDIALEAGVATAVPAEYTVTIVYGTANETDTITVVPDSVNHDESAKTVSFVMGTEDVTVTITGAAANVDEDEDGDDENNDDENNGGENNGGENNGGENNGGGNGDSVVKVAKDQVTVDYANEKIVVANGSQVYYQIVKTSETKSNLKTANWIKAAKAPDGKYWIDFSATSNSKDVFFALTIDATKGNADYVETVDAAIKSVKATLAYDKENGLGGLADVISELNVKGADANYTDAHALVANGGTDAQTILTTDATKSAKVFSLKWKRGANGSWAGAETFKDVDWNMLKASNGTLYIAIDGMYSADGTDEGDDADLAKFRLSKEAKVKIPKSAKAPTVKVDYVKGTLALKNGMEIRLEKDGDWTAWMDVIEYKKGGTDNGLFALASDAKTTSKKASKVAIAEFVDALKTYLGLTTNGGEDVKLEIRTAATVKKFPSMAGIMKIKLPAAAPNLADGVGSGEDKEPAALTYTKANKANNVTAKFDIEWKELFTKDANKQYSAYEFMLVADAKDGVNLEKQKWTKISGDKQDLAKFIGKAFTYYKKGSNDKSTVNYELAKAIYVRLAAEKPTSKDVPGVFASEYVVIPVTITENIPTTGTPAPGDEEKEDATEFTIDWSGENCTVTVTYGETDTAVTKNNTKVAKGAEVTVTVEASQGYEVTGISGKYGDSNTDLTITGAASPYTFMMPEGNVTLAIVTAEQGNQTQPNEYTVTFSGEGASEIKVGDVSKELSGNTLTVEENAVVTFKAEGKTVTIGEAVQDAIDGVYSVTVTENVTIVIEDAQA